MDLYTYLLSSTGNPIKPKRKGRKPKKAKKIKWGTPHPKGFKNYANKPTGKLDTLLTTLNSKLSVNTEDNKRRAELVQDYGYVMSIPEAQKIVNKNKLLNTNVSTDTAAGLADIKTDTAEALAKGEIKETDIDKFVMNRAYEKMPERELRDGSDFNLDEVADNYGKKWESIDRELDDLLTTLNTGGGVETMRKEALSKLKKKRSNLLMEGLQQEEFMLEGLTGADNKDFRNKFIDKFKEGQLKDYQSNISSFGEKLSQIDNQLEIKEMNTYDFNLEEAMKYSPQEAEQELNLLEKEMSEISTQTEQLQEQIQTEQPVEIQELGSVVEQIREAQDTLSLSRSNSALSRTSSRGETQAAPAEISAAPAEISAAPADKLFEGHFRALEKTMDAQRAARGGREYPPGSAAAKAAAYAAANDAYEAKLVAKAERKAAKKKEKGKAKKDPPMPPPSP